MQSYAVTLPKPASEYITLFAISCLHVGHKGHDAARAKRYQQYILNTPDVYAMSLGDDVDMALPGDEKHNQMMWDASMTPDEQYMVACEYWRPLAEAGKLVASFDSNHWYRAEAKTGMSRARDLNVFLQNQSGEPSRLPLPSPNKMPFWGKWQSMFKITVGDATYTVHATHGSGGGTTPGAALKKVLDTANYIHADVYLRGHHHKRIVYEDPYYDWPPGAQAPVERKRVFGCTGCFLHWNDSYAERSGLPPATRGAIKVEMCSTRHDVRISL